MPRELGEKLREVRLSQRLSQEALAEIAGINPNYISEIECGKKNPTAVVVQKLAKSLKIPVCRLLNNDNCLYMRKK